jgi:serine/threonine protein kinase
MTQPASLPIQRLRDALVKEYTIDRELGRGGMATVYLAQDIKHDRVVALKVLHPDLAVALGPDRFLREIRLAARLNHPHILPLFDSGDADGLLYYVMPYVEGESLLMGINDVAVSSGSACTSATLEPAYVLKALGLGDDVAHSSIRFGLGRFNTQAEVDYVAAKVIDIVKKLRELSPLYEMVKEGIDLTKIEWQAH